jgi:hypothetical protein
MALCNALILAHNNDLTLPHFLLGTQEGHVLER